MDVQRFKVINRGRDAADEFHRDVLGMHVLMKVAAFEVDIFQRTSL